MDFLDKNKIQFKGLAEKHGLNLLYAHGSVVDGTMGPLSDVDIALLFGPQKEAPPLTMRGVLYSDLCDIFGRDDIDMADLAMAGPLLRYLVARGGQCLYARSSDEQTLFEFHALRDYLDTMSLRHIYWQGLSSAIRSGKFYS